MQSDTKTLNMFETEPIGRLMVRFSAPAIFAMTVNALYNIVDQIFISQGVGYLGNTATSITLPLSTIIVAVAGLIGDGSGACFSLALGEGNTERAGKAIGNALMLSLAAGAAILLLAEVLMHPFLVLCGGHPGTESWVHAMNYGRIIAIGAPFVTGSFALNASIRAQGHPGVATAAMVSGCLINIVLDAWFIFGLGWGVSGAAAATVIGQMTNLAIGAAYIPRLKAVPYRLQNMRPDLRLISEFLPLGISSFCTQFLYAVIVVCYNQLFVKYGELSPYGADLPLAVQGIVLKVNSLVTGVMAGIGAGCQPIIGYNYGAGRFDRVRTTYIRMITAGMLFGLAGWSVFQFSPEPIIALFGQDDPLFVELSIKFFREILFFLYLCGFFFPTGSFFQAIGRPVKAALCIVIRNLFLFIPLGYILSHFMGLQGLLYSTPAADLLASIIIVFMVIPELRDMKSGQITK